MPLYFAYGLNLDRAGMAARCPKAVVLGPARLARHRFIVTRDGYASVLRDPRREVHGILWDISQGDVRSLDRFEDVARGLYTKIVQPVIAPGGAKRALVYVGRSGEPGLPKPGYMEAVLDAARAWDLPKPYLDEMSGWLPGPRGAGTRQVP